MPEVRCADVGADTCKGHFKAGTKDELARQVADHLHKVHEVKAPTQTFLTYYLKKAS